MKEYSFTAKTTTSKPFTERNQAGFRQDVDAHSKYVEEKKNGSIIPTPLVKKHKSNRSQIISSQGYTAIM